MKKDISLRALERKAFISYHNDGLLDIWIGFIIVSFAVSMMLDFVAFIGIFSATGVTFLTVSKKMITIPRAGIVNFGAERNQRIAREKSFFMVFFTATLLIGIAVFFMVAVRGNWLYDFMRTFILAPIGIIGAAAFSFLAYWKELKRYYVYTALILLTVFGGPITGLEPPVYFLIGGFTILIPGIMVLVRFLKQFPLDREGE